MVGEKWGEYMQGTGVSKGLCLAKIVVLKEVPVHLNDVPKGFTEEKRLFENAVASVYEKTKKLAEKTMKNIGKDEAAIFEAHCSILRDRELIEPILELIGHGKNAVSAIEDIMNKYIRIFDEMENEYMKQRVADIQDIKLQLQRNILGIEMPDLSELEEDIVIVSEDISPSMAAGVDLEHVRGMIMAGGGKTSHTAILARTLEIPAVIGVQEILEVAENGDLAAIDGERGEVYINPPDEVCRQFNNRIKLEEEEKKRKQKLAAIPCETADGCRVRLYGNIGTARDVGKAVYYGAEGIGLLRSEFLYLSGDRIPGEEEQYKAYTHVLKAMEEAPVIVRTLDIGGDKEVPALQLEKEENPFLGLRAIRLCKVKAELFKTQIRALLRASVNGNLHIMFPMISSLDELRWAKEMVKECKKQLIKEGIAVKEEIPLGIMIEVPSTAVMADDFAAECDFFSIGTNDLTQYTLAVDRGNDSVSELYSFYHPAVIWMIRHAIEGAHRNGIPCGMCGEAAGDKKMIPLLIGLGLDEYSMSAGTLLDAKELILKLDSESCKKLSERICNIKTAAEIELALEEYLEEKGIRETDGI